jgi:hypothetical protein
LVDDSFVAAVAHPVCDVVDAIARTKVVLARRCVFAARRLEGVELTGPGINWSIGHLDVGYLTGGGHVAIGTGLENMRESKPVADFMYERCAFSLSGTSKRDAGQTVDVNEATIVYYVWRRCRQRAVAISPGSLACFRALEVINLLDDENVDVLICPNPQVGHHLSLGRIFFRSPRFIMFLMCEMPILIATCRVMPGCWEVGETDIERLKRVRK